MALIIAFGLVAPHPSRALAPTASIATVIVPANVGEGEDIDIEVTVQYEFQSGTSVRLFAEHNGINEDLVEDVLEGTGHANYTLTVSTSSSKDPDDIARIRVKLYYYTDPLEAPVIVSSETHEVTIGTTAQSVLEPAASTIHLYPTAPNSTTITVDPRAASLPGPVNLHVTANLPPGVELSLSTDYISPSTGATEVTLNATLDATEAASIRLPQDVEVTISATSGGFREADTLTLSLRPAEWLVMLYLAADTDPDLQGSLLNNLNDVLTVTRTQPTPKVGYLTLLDLREDATVAGTRLTGDRAILHQIRDGELVLIRDWGPTDMSEKGTLGGFITEATKNIPSERRLLVIGDHGAGYYRGLVKDHHQGDGYIDVTSLAEALENHEIDVLGLDACHMAQFEVAYALRESADYIILSQIEMPGEGYAYEEFLEGLAMNPETEPLDLARGIVLAHEGKYDGSEGAQYSFGMSTTLSAIDASKLGGLKDSLEDLGGIISERFGSLSEEQKKDLKKIVTRFYYDQVEVANYRWIYADIRHVASQIYEKIGNTRIRSAAEGVVTALDSAVVADTGRLFNRGGGFNETESKFHGLSVFLPHWDYVKYLKEYSNTPIVASMPRWWSFLNHYSSFVINVARQIEAKLEHPDHQLYLHVYDGEGNHLGYEPSLLDYSREQIERGIHGSDYVDYGNGTTVASIPARSGEFTFTVDGSRMEEDAESYTITYTLVEGGETVWSQTYEGTINLNELHITLVTVTEEGVSIGDPPSDEREEETYTARIVGLEVPDEVDAGSSFTVGLTVSYEFITPTEMSPGVYDPETETWIVEEYETLEGNGSRTYSFELTAPEGEITWALEAGVWYYLESEWTHDEEGYADTFEIAVIIEEEDVDNGDGRIPGFPFETVVLGAAVAVLILLYTRRDPSFSLAT